MQPVKVRSEELSVRLGSYLGGDKGDQIGGAPETEARDGGSASMRAATRVKPEQASKGLMCAPSRLSYGEGRRDWSINRQKTRPHAGVVGAARMHAAIRDTG